MLTSNDFAVFFLVKLGPEKNVLPEGAGEEPGLLRAVGYPACHGRINKLEGKNIFKDFFFKLSFFFFFEGLYFQENFFYFIIFTLFSRKLYFISLFLLFFKKTLFYFIIFTLFSRNLYFILLFLLYFQENFILFYYFYFIFKNTCPTKTRFTLKTTSEITTETPLLNTSVKAR